MTLAELPAIAVALGADAFSVGVGLGARHFDWGARGRLGGAFGLSQFAMTMLGSFLGAVILRYVAAYDHWVTFGVLAAIALKMLWESFRAEKSEGRGDPTRGLLLVALAVAVSIDALAVGITMGQMDSRRWLYALVIGVTSTVMTVAGMVLAHRGERHLGAWAERLGALLLLGVAVKLLLEV